MKLNNIDFDKLTDNEIKTIVFKYKLSIHKKLIYIKKII